MIWSGEATARRAVDGMFDLYCSLYRLADVRVRLPEWLIPSLLVLGTMLNVG